MESNFTSTPILNPNNTDVLCGRGNYVKLFCGNVRYRELVKKHQNDYASAPKTDKLTISKKIYSEIKTLDPPGRFLKRSDDTSPPIYYELTEKDALIKICQALREDQPQTRKKLGISEPKEMKYTMNNGTVKHSKLVSPSTVAEFNFSAWIWRALIDAHLQAVYTR